MSRRSSFLLPSAAAIAALCVPAVASAADPVATFPTSSACDWEFRVEPYGWLTGLKGETGIGPLVTEIDPSFADIFDHIDMAAAIQMEARNGCWGIIADGFYADLGADGSSPGPLYDSVEVDMRQFIGELTLGYRVYQTDDAFVDVYGGIRYNDLSVDFEASLDQTGIEAASDSAAERIVSGIAERAREIVGPKVDDFKAASAERRGKIEDRVSSAIGAEAARRVKRDALEQIRRIGRDGGVGERDLAAERIVRAVKAQRIELARSTARLEVAKLRAAADAALQSKVAQAQERVDKAERKLASAISDRLQSSLPTSMSANKDWIDPILGVRAQWNFGDPWFLAAKSDIGGFGVGSDLTWSVQATLGYQFTDSVSAELGYRYLQTDYEDGAFTYDMAAHGVFTGLNIRF